MSFKLWVLNQENQSGLAHTVMLTTHFIKKNPGKKFQVLLSSLVYFLGALQWRILLTVVHPLNKMRETTVALKIRGKCIRMIPSLRKHYYEVEMPVNLQDQHKKIFANNYYFLKPLKPLQLRDYQLYITSYFGIAFKNYHILRESIHGRWASRRKAVFKDYYRRVMDAWLYAQYEKKENVTELNDAERYLHIHHWFNYYHWLTETLVRLWVVKAHVDDFTLLLPEGLKQIGFVQQSLEVFNVKKIHWVKEGVPVQVKNLTMAQNKPYCNHYDPVQMKQMGHYFREYVASHCQVNLDFGDKLFITRKKAERRKLVNEAEIEGLLAEYGFKTLALEDYTLFQEVSIMSKAKYLIGMHGAGLTNMLFMPAGGKVLELHRAVQYADAMHSDVYWKLASALGHKYYYQFCEAEDSSRDFFEADLLVDNFLFEENLRKILS